jgi:hypothetical protein
MVQKKHLIFSLQPAMCNLSVVGVFILSIHITLLIQLGIAMLIAEKKWVSQADACHHR